MNFASPAGKAVPLAGLLAVSLALAACGGGTEEPAASPAPVSVTEPVVATYDGGLYVLDGRSLELAATIPLPGFNRVNPAGDDAHVMVSTADGFRVLDAAAGELTDVAFPAAEPGHVVRHAGRTVLFADGTGEVTIFDPKELAAGEKPSAQTHRTPEAHHGVAVLLANGELLTTLGNADERVGITVLDADRKEITRNEKCPGVHGEATAADETVVVGCQDGVLIYRDGRITKVDSPTEYGRIGNQAGSPDSAVVLGDYKKDPDAELERPEQVSLIDTATGGLRLVDLGTSYTFRSLARGRHAEALVLGTDGAVHVIDPETAKVTRKIPVIAPWEEPLEWQSPRPALVVRDHTAYITDPATRTVHALDLETAKTLATVTLPETPNELTAATAH